MTLRALRGMLGDEGKCLPPRACHITARKKEAMPLRPLGRWRSTLSDSLGTRIAFPVQHSPFGPQNQHQVLMSTLSLSTLRQRLSGYDKSGLGIPAIVLLIMAMLVLPLPPL